MLFEILFSLYLAVQGLLVQGHGQNPAPANPPAQAAQIAEKADINTGR